MSEGDEYPQQACNGCIKTLSIAYRFQQMVLSNNKILVDVVRKKTKLSTTEELEMELEILDTKDSLLADTNITEEISRKEDVCKETDLKNCVSKYEDEANKEGVTEGSTVSAEEESKPIKCPHCPALLNDELNLKIHLITHREPCRVCKKPIPRRGLARHMRTHAPVRPHACRFCQTRFADPSNLARHVASHTKGGGGKGDLCPFCGKKFKWRSSLHKHMRYHTGAGLHKCHYCSKAFSSPSTLKVHMLKYQDRRFECRECASTFSQQSSLRKHARSAHGAGAPRRQLECAQCGHVFMSKESMELHMSRTHGGDRPYKCRQCDRAFAYQKSLAKHTSSHDRKDSSEKDIRATSVLGTHLCVGCGQKFATDELMKIHTKLCTGKRDRTAVPQPAAIARHRCAVCSLALPDRGGLLAHYSTAHHMVPVEYAQ